MAPALEAKVSNSSNTLVEDEDSAIKAVPAFPSNKPKKEEEDDSDEEDIFKDFAEDEDAGAK